MEHLFIIISFMSAVSYVESNATNIEDKIKEYFNSEIIQTFHNTWLKNKISQQKALTRALAGTYGAEKNLNIYLKEYEIKRKLTDAFFIDDGQVQVLLTDLYLRDMPTLVFPEVFWPLSNHTIHLESQFSTIFIDANYILYRNKSQMVLEKYSEDSERSPFLYQEAKHTGRVAIVADECKLSGFAIAKLIGSRVNIGHNTFELTECKFHIEIYNPNIGSPPLIAPYFSLEKAKTMENLMRAPIIEELMIKLQSNVFSIVDTNEIFDKDVPKIRHRQTEIFRECSEFITKVIKNMNWLAAKASQLPAAIKVLNIYTDDESSSNGKKNSITVKDIFITGLDSAYSSGRGGPFMESKVLIAEEIKFNVLQIRGKLIQGEDAREENFAAELLDLAINIELDARIQKRVFKKPKIASFRAMLAVKFQVVGCRAVEIIASSQHALLKGYIVSQVIGTVKEYLYPHYARAVMNAGNEINDTLNLSADRSDAIEQRELLNSMELENSMSIEENQSNEENISKGEHLSTEEYLFKEEVTFTKSDEDISEEEEESN